MRSILITAPILIAGDSFRHLCRRPTTTLPKSGGCPPGFRESGKYCVASEDTWTLAIPRAPNQGCPVGWVGHGAYCSRLADRR
jgi:hypothetical protein